MEILIVDGQGGGIGKALVALTAPLKGLDGLTLFAAGTNRAALAAMTAAGAVPRGFGSASIIAAVKAADIIAGPAGIIIAGSMGGEITAAVAAAVSGRSCPKVLIPISRCGIFFAGASDVPLSAKLEEAAGLIKSLAQDRGGTA